MRIRSVSFLCFGVLSAAGPSSAIGASSGEPSSIGALTNIGPGMLIIAVAAGLILTLLVRPTIGVVARSLAQTMGRRRITRCLDRNGAAVLHDFILPGAYGGLTRIDHALMTGGGVFCIQSRHYKGVVFGEPDDPQWTNVEGVRSRRFLNPQIQNEGRANALRKLVPGLPVANLVVFTGPVQFTSPREKNVIHIRDLERFIGSFDFGPSAIEDWDAAWLTIRSAALTDEGSRKDLDAQLSFG